MNGENTSEREDYGEVVKGHSRGRMSVVWVFPILAAAAATWLFWSHWQSNGPEIEIQFDSAPGLQPNKTQIIFRGVEVGKVTAVSLDEKLDKVIVKARLKANAANLARKNTAFWVDEPEISLLQVTGLEAIIQGNSIRAWLGDGPPATKFMGLNKPPVNPDQTPWLNLRLQANKLPGVVRGAPIYYRGIPVGVVKGAHIDNGGQPYLQVIIKEDYKQVIRSNARFWAASAAQAEIGPGGLRLDIPGVAALVQGGIEFDFFSDDHGDAVQDESVFELFPTEQAARANSPPIRISLESGAGIWPGVTQLRYLGVIVGLVVEMHPNFATGCVDVIARLEPGFEMFRRKGTIFSLVRAKISLKGVSGLDTLVRGVYIDCVPGPEGEKYADNFIAQPYSEAELQTEEKLEKSEVFEESKFNVVVTAQSTTISADAPVFYRGIQVGKVTRKALASNGRNVDLYLEIDEPYAALIRSNTKFWDMGGLNASLGFFSIKVSATSLAALVHGGVAFATPNDSDMGPQVKRGQHFELNRFPRGEWLKWAPSIPKEKR